MPAVLQLCQLANLNPEDLSKEENFMLEYILFSQICEKLKEVFKNQHKDYFRIIKLSHETENTIMDTNFARCIVNDIISSEEYTLSGVACYTNTTDDVILEIVAGRNTDPSASLLRRIIELHRSVRPDLYREIMKKLVDENCEIE
jgi:hypothetical protein